MFVVSGGLQKSGSTLLHYYAIHLLSLQFGDAGQPAFKHWISNGPVGGRDSFAWDAWIDHVDELENLCAKNGPFVLKTHSSFERIEGAIRGHDVKMIFSFRDPRDVVLSLIDHGRRSRANGDYVFADCVDLQSTLRNLSEWCEVAVSWFNAPGILRFRYEDLVNSPVEEVYKLAQYLGIRRPRRAAELTVEYERSQRCAGKNEFNVGLALRWPTEMSEYETELCEEHLGHYIQLMGYELHGKQSAP